MANATVTIQTNYVATATITYTAPAGDSTYKNSDGSFIEAIPCGNTFIAPDVVFIDNLGTPNTVPANTNFAAPALPIAYVQLGYPGNSTVYTVGDSGTQLANGAFNRSTIGVTPILTDNDTLSVNTLNAFGNTNHWTDELGTQIYTNNYAIDHFTGLGWYLIEQPVATWINAITNSQSFIVPNLLYNDMRLPLQVEIMNIWRIFGTAFKTIEYSPFNNSVDFTMWTCESALVSPSTKSDVLRTSNTVTSTFKTLSRQYYLVRKHYP